VDADQGQRIAGGIAFHDLVSNAYERSAKVVPVQDDARALQA
jgi:hypothetical protein